MSSRCYDLNFMSQRLKVIAFEKSLALSTVYPYSVDRNSVHLATRNYPHPISLSSVRVN